MPTLPHHLRPLRALLLACLASSACDGPPAWEGDTGANEPTPPGLPIRLTGGCVDLDQDGACAGPDCDDADPARHPLASELTGDGVDSDCDGGESCLFDRDDDGALAHNAPTRASADPDCDDAYEGRADDPRGDCDDLDPVTRPGASEQPGDERDQDCDGTELCFVDADDDGFLAPRAGVVPSTDLDCRDPGEGRVGQPFSDCDDEDAGDYPAAPEVVDNGDDESCDGAELCGTDADGDGWAGERLTRSDDLSCEGDGEATATTPRGDCDDDDDAVHPGATELPADRTDSDCDGGDLCFTDADDDGAASPNLRSSADLDCFDPGEADADAPVDCDDADPARRPGATESPGDEVDQDCDGREQCYIDGDEDGFRAAEPITSADPDCSDPGEATAATPGVDCNDLDPMTHPGGTEVAGDERDQDCDGSELCFVDADADGYRTELIETVDGLRCDGFATLDAPPGDCDDADPARFPGAPELDDDGVDADCDGEDGAKAAASCACDQRAAPPPALLLALLLAARRRTPQQPPAGVARSDG
jgi:hypothetical protein